ncbi:MAG TPA: M1 family aminopeptidase [Bryobacteraceae bacterium]|nr:M1 family aminopeptidase [Bryobacteraceae bacterium]
MKNQTDPLPTAPFLATLLYVVRVLLSILAGAGVLTAGVGTDLAREFQAISLDPELCYRVTELNLAKEDIKVYLASGYLIFTKPVGGFRQGAVFVASADAGDAEVLLLPPSRSERLSLATFTKFPNLEEHFKAAAFLFSDATAAELLARIDADSSGKKMPELGNVLVEQWNPTMRYLENTFETSLVHDALSNDRKSGFFYMAVSGNQLGNFDLLYDPGMQEQIFVGNLAYRNNRAYFDSWSSFPSRSVRNGAAPPGPPAVLDDFRIDATIGEDLKMTAVTRALLTLKRADGAPLRFSISPNMRVTEARIDGNPVEVFSRGSLPSNVLTNSEESEFLLIPSRPLDPGQPHELEVHHEGEVIHQAGQGVYYVNSRGTWYPRMGIEFANYDLTFRYPRNLTLVSTGGLVEDRTEGDWRIMHRKTESPIRFAGFNLGDFQSASINEKGYLIDVYANRHIETALQPKGPVVADPAPAAVIRPRRRDPRELLPDVMLPLPPDPAGRLAQVEKDVVETLDFMTQEFGPSATRNLAITPIPGNFGQGFPGLVYLSTLAYLNPGQRPEQLQAHYPETFYSELLEPHEIAHQWWGNLVIPASYRDEWLIEALANYCALLLLEKNKGVKALNDVLDDYRDRLLSKTENGHTLESSGPITWGRRLQSSLAPDAWQVVAYQKGTWIMHMLRRQLGDENFYSLLRDVANRYRLSPISTGQFRELAQAYTAPGSKDRTLRNFFENWVDGTGIPAVKLSYSWSGGKLSGELSQANVGDDFTALVPVEVQSAKQKAVYWLPTGSDPIPFKIPLSAPPARVALLGSDCLMTISR